VSVAPGYPVRRWTDEELDAHATVGPHAAMTCQGCIQRERREYEREAVDAREVITVVADGWL
jgi:hypothetical protein